MNKFNIGDTVRLIEEDSGCTHYAVGTLFTVTGFSDVIDEDGYPLMELSTKVDSYAYIYVWKQTWFELVEESTVQKESNMFQFNVSSEDAIDFMEIRQDLSRSNPIAKVEFKSEDGERKYYVVIHDSLLEKANTLSIPDPTNDYYNYYVELDSPAEYAEWAKWARKVISTEWGGTKGVVTVSPLKVRI